MVSMHPSSIPASFLLVHARSFCIPLPFFSSLAISEQSF